MQEKNAETLTRDKMQLEVQLIINRRLYEKDVIDRVTYETVTNELLKSIQTIKVTKKG
jgi:hypothetical protein